MSVWSGQQNTPSYQQQPRRNPYQQNQQNGLGPSPQTYDRMAPRQQNTGGSMMQSGSGIAGYGANGTSTGGYNQTQARTGYGLGGNYNPGLSGNRRARQTQPIAPSPAVAPQVPPNTAAAQPTAQASPTQYDPPDEGYNGGGNKFDAYGAFADAVGHDGTAKSGMNRDAYRDAWMGSGIGDSAGMDAWLAANGGERLNDAGVVRTPFGEILDMGIGYKGGKGRAGWTNIGMNG
jgi:hypothetical protein